jgi:hypothetical protein
MAAPNEVTVPSEDRVGSHQQSKAMQRRPRKPLQQRGQQRPIGRFEADPLPAQLAPQNRELVTQRQDLHILVPIASRQQPQ